VLAVTEDGTPDTTDFATVPEVPEEVAEPQSSQPG
jgi:hypothetical protein